LKWPLQLVIIFFACNTNEDVLKFSKRFGLPTLTFPADNTVSCVNSIFSLVKDDPKFLLLTSFLGKSRKKWDLGETPLPKSDVAQFFLLKTFFSQYCRQVGNNFVGTPSAINKFYYLFFDNIKIETIFIDEATHFRKLDCPILLAINPKRFFVTGDLAQLSAVDVLDNYIHHLDSSYSTEPSFMHWLIALGYPVEYIVTSDRFNEVETKIIREVLYDKDSSVQEFPVIPAIVHVLKKKPSINVIENTTKLDYHRVDPENPDFYDDWIYMERKFAAEGFTLFLTPYSNRCALMRRFIDRNHLVAVSQTVRKFEGNESPKVLYDLFKVTPFVTDKMITVGLTRHNLPGLTTVCYNEIRFKAVIKFVKSNFEPGQLGYDFGTRYILATFLKSHYYGILDNPGFMGFISDKDYGEYMLLKSLLQSPFSRAFSPHSAEIFVYNKLFVDKFLNLKRIRERFKENNFKDPSIDLVLPDAMLATYNAVPDFLIDAVVKLGFSYDWIGPFLNMVLADDEFRLRFKERFRGKSNHLPGRRRRANGPILSRPLLLGNG